MYEVVNSRFHNVFLRPQKKKLFVGGGGSGKSISIAQHMCIGLLSKDGCRRLILRKYFPSFKKSTLVVIKAILDDWKVTYKHHSTDHYFQVGNNYLVYDSLDSSEKVKGSEYKEIWMEEATDFTEEDYKQLTIRLARDKNSEDTTLILSFNPIGQGNWCVKLLDEAAKHPKEYFVHHSTYKDNIKNLSKSFVRELKSYKDKDPNFYNVYALGIAGKLENQIFTNFIIDDARKWPWPKLNSGLHVYGLDFGFNHPMSLCEVFYADGEFYARELFYKRECTTDDLAVWMQVNKVDHNCDIFADSAEPDRIRMLSETRTVTSKITGKEITTKVNRFNAKEAKKDVKAGLDYIKSQKIHIDSSSENAIKEIRNYRYKTTRTGEVIDEPVKVMDDFCFVAGTLITTDNGKVPIEKIKIGDKVLTRSGFKEVEKCWMTNANAEVKTLVFENGNSLTGTRNHPIFIIGKGFISLDTIRYGDYVLPEDQELKMSSGLLLTELYSDDTPVLSAENTDAIILQAANTNTEVYRHSIKKYGNITVEKSQVDTTSTIKTGTPSITQLKTSNAFNEMSILKNTRNKEEMMTSGLKRTRNILKISDHSQKNGTHRRRGDSGIQKTEKEHGNSEHLKKKYVNSVEKSLNASQNETRIGSVQTTVNPLGDENRDWMTKQGYAYTVEQNLKSINIQKQLHALKVVQLNNVGSREEVYNLTVKDAHEYFANGILVHNCDSLRYAIFSTKVNYLTTIPENFSKGYSFSDKFRVDKFRL